LLLKLADLDANAESAVRVIAFFDALAEQHANLDQVLRSAAALAGCRVRIRSARLPGGVRVGAEGGPVPAGPRSWACPVASGGEVWLERAGGPLPQDEMLLERLAIACASLTGTGFPALAGRDDPELVELVISSEAGVAERSRALSLLGFTARSAVQVAYVTGPFAGLLDGLQSRSNLVRHAVLGGGTVLLVAGTVPRTVAADLGACVGVGLAVQRWMRQRRGRARSPRAGLVQPGRFRAPRGGLVGRSRPAGPAGKPDHHNSVAARVARTEEQVGFSLGTGTGRTRLTLAIALRRFRDSSPDVEVTRADASIAGRSPAPAEIAPDG
jgi:hypothetical protein